MKKKEVIVRVGGTPPSIPFQRLRVKAGLTQEKAAEKLSCGTRTLQRYEAGEKEPPLKILRKMLTCYNCEIGDLIPLANSLDEIDSEERV